MSSRIRFARGSGAAYRIAIEPDHALVVSREPDADPAGGDAAIPTVIRLRADVGTDGHVLVLVDGRQREAWVADVGGQRAVFLDGNVYLFEIDDRPAGAARARTRPGNDSLMAPMPATVVRILASVDQPVRRGETLLLLEAMKMELPLKAPHDGVVTAVRCAAGDLVQPGVALIDLGEA